jgi:hypothetical protein
LTNFGAGNDNHSSNTFTNGDLPVEPGIQRELPGKWLLDINTQPVTPCICLGTIPLKIAITFRRRIARPMAAPGRTTTFPILPYLFTQVSGKPAPIINDPNSTYNFSTIPQIDLLRLFPQFPEVFPAFQSLWQPDYQLLQVRFEKRWPHG